MDYYEILHTECSKYIHKENSIKLIKKAFNYARNKHKNQKRASGEEYFVHVWSVGLQLSKWRVSPNTICAGLLHDVVEDQDVSSEDITKEFNEDICFLVEKMTKIKNAGYRTTDIDYLNVRRLIISMASNIRVILIKLADRLHNMRTIQYLPPAKQKRIATETFYIYRNIAYLVGMHDVSSEFSDLCFKTLEPKKYYEVEKKTKFFVSDVNDTLEKLEAQLKEVISSKSIKSNISARVKSIYSIYKKMNDKNKKFSEIHDILALRIVTNTEDNCYRIFGLVQNNFVYVIELFKDYISRPKRNLYQSLHTAIIIDKEIVEIQIRTEEMNQVASTGIASHWQYKENTNYNPKDEQKQIENKLWFFQQLSEFEKSHSKLQQDDEYIKEMHNEVFESQIFALSPNGDVLSLKRGSTVLDFAFKVHTEVGMHASGGFINNKLVPLEKQINNGDVVEIKTNQNSFPKREWLSKVSTSLAQKVINKYLRTEQEDTNKTLINKGKTIFDKFCAANENLAALYSNKEQFLKILKQEEYLSTEHFLKEVGNRTIKMTYFVNKILKSEPKKKIVFTASKKSKLKNDIIVKGGEDMKIDIAKCCYPIPGELIVGLISKQHSFKIHRNVCTNFKKIIARENNSESWMEATWNTEKTINNEYVSSIKVVVKQESNNYLEITNNISFAKATISEMKSKPIFKLSQAIFNLKVNVKDLEHLNTIMRNLRRYSKLISVERNNS